MPNYAILSSGIRQVAANTLIGNSTGLKGSAEELSATDAKTLLGLGTTDAPTFASAYLDNIYHSSGGGRLQLGSSGYTLYAELSCNRLLPRADGTYDLGAETLAWNNIKNTGSILCYNGGTSDSTNYERGFLEWDSNVFTIGTQAAGTGLDRGINFVTGGTTRGGFNTSGKLQAGSKIYLHATATSNQPYITNSADYLAVSSQKGFLASHFSDRTSGDVHTFTQSSSSIEMTDTDGPQSFMSITPKVGQSGTAAYNGLKIDITESSLGDGSTGDGNNAILATVGGISKFKVSNAGMITTAAGNGSGTAGGLMLGNSIGWISRGTGSVELASGAAEYVEIASDGITLRTGNSFGWSANNNPQDGSGPRFWENTSTETIELRRGTTALGFSVANTWVDANNLEFGVFDWTTTANTLTIGTQAAGTGTVRDLVLATGGTETIKVAGTNQRVTISADRTAIGSGSSHQGVLNLGGDRVMTFHGGNSSIRCPSGQLDFRTSTSVFTLVGNTIRFQGYDGGGFLNIRNYSTGGAGTVVIRKLASQTSDLLKVLDDSGNNLFNLQHTGDFVLGLNSTTNPNIYSYGSFSDASNYERGVVGWDSNVFSIGTQAAGTGLDRDLELLPATGNVLVPATGKIAFSTRLTLNGSSRRLMTDNSQTLQLQGSSFTTSQTVSAVDIGGNFTDADGNQKVLSLTPTYNQSGIAGGTDILVNRMEQAVGSGEQNLMDLQVGGTSKFKVDNAGNAVMSGVVNQMTSSASLPSTTEFPNDQDWGIHHDTLNDHIYLAFNKSGSIKRTLIN